MPRTSVRFFLIFCAAALALSSFVLVFSLVHANAHNILSYKDTITDSRPNAYSNHTLDFTLNTSVSPGGYIEITPPSGFSITASSTFSARDVEVYVNGIARTASSSLDTNVDQVVITPGAPGSIRYNLNPTTGISSGAQVKMKIGNITSQAQGVTYLYSSTTGTTTVPADAPPILNGNDTGSKLVHMEIGGSAEPAYADFYIAIINSISTGRVDTTEKVPPYRYNGLPTGEVGGTTLYVEISLQTDERAVCKYSKTASTSFQSMTNTFSTTGLIVHSQIVQIATGTVNTYYVRCIDDEGNYNIDDYAITFTSLPPPSGSPNGGGDIQGDGSGTGNNGTGSGGTGSGDTGSGTGTSGGSSSGSGGSGGGGGGVSGADSSGLSGGGFENNFGAYPSGDAQVVISGYAFPNSTVYILVDGAAVQSTRATNTGSFTSTIDQIARGVYTFGIYAAGGDGKKSSTFSTSFTVTGGKTSSLSNINVMPSITVKPDPVTPGQPLAVSGYAIPNAEITVENQNGNSSASKKTFTANSDSSGKWSLSIDTTGFSAGTYKIRAKAVQTTGLNLQTNFSDYTFYGVGQSANVPLSADLNTDGKVNLTDFSILLYWWGGDGGNSNPPADINRDGKVNLTDFSIMLFNWTG